MAATDFIVAIELGSSKITGIAGKKHPDGSIQVLALASEPSSDFIRKGVIYNLDKTAQSLTSIIKKLESTLKASIGKVYVGIGGQLLRTIRNTEVRHLEEETKISQELIDSLMDSNREVPIIDQDILEVAPQEYKHRRCERMDILKIVLMIIFVIDCIALSAIILLQEGKSAGLGTNSGAADSYWGQNKGRSMEGALVKSTKFLAILFLVLAAVLNLKVFN